MLKQNTTILCQMPLRQIGGLFAGERTMFGQTERLNAMTGEASWSPQSGLPNGHLAPSSWMLPRVAGGLSAYTSVGGVGNISADGIAALFANATMDGAGGLDALGALVVQLSATLAGSGGVSSAAINAFLAAAATLAGSGDFTGTPAGLGEAVANIVGVGGMTGVSAAFGAMSATIRGYGDLTPEGLRDAVWSALAASFNEAGTMGQKMNSAASGGVDYAALGAAVWSILKANAVAPGSMGELVNSLGTLDKQLEILANLDNVAISSGSLSASANGFVLTTGNVITGSFTDVRTQNGVLHQINDVGGVMEFEYTFNIGRDAVPSGLSVFADLSGSNDLLIVQAYNYVTSSFEQIGTRQGDNNSKLDTNEYTLLTAHSNTAGDVRIKYTGAGMTSASFKVDVMLATYAVVSRRIGYVGSVVSAAANTIVLDTDASGLDNYYYPALAVITGGTGRDQSRRVDGYVGATRTLTVATPWTTVPDSTSTVELHPWGSVRVSDVDPGVIVESNVKKVNDQTIYGAGIPVTDVFRVTP